MYVVTGATSRTGSIIVNALLDHGLPVRALGRDPGRLDGLVDRGAEAFVAEPQDKSAMARAFEGAQAAWVMIQPNYVPDSPDFRAFQNATIEAVVPALAGSRVGHVVALTSWGADKASGTGPVMGLRDLEQALDRVDGPDTMMLRAGYFMENSLGFIDQLLAGDVVRSALRPDIAMPWVSTGDIGALAAIKLMARDFEGRHVLEVQGERDLDLREVVAILAGALDRPALRYEQISADDARRDLLDAGMSEAMADTILEAHLAINDGHLRTMQPRTKHTTTPTSFEMFARDVWLPAYASRRAERAPGT